LHLEEEEAKRKKQQVDKWSLQNNDAEQGEIKNLIDTVGVGMYVSFPSCIYISRYTFLLVCAFFYSCRSFYPVETNQGRRGKQAEKIRGAAAEFEGD
jgi:hypothetical protein